MVVLLSGSETLLSCHVFAIESVEQVLCIACEHFSVPCHFRSLNRKRPSSQVPCQEASDIGLDPPVSYSIFLFKQSSNLISSGLTFIPKIIFIQLELRSPLCPNLIPLLQWNIAPKPLNLWLGRVLYNKLNEIDPKTKMK